MANTHRCGHPGSLLSCRPSEDPRRRRGRKSDSDGAETSTTQTLVDKRDTWAPLRLPPRGRRIARAAFSNPFARSRTIRGAKESRSTERRWLRRTRPAALLASSSASPAARLPVSAAQPFSVLLGRRGPCGRQTRPCGRCSPLWTCSTFRRPLPSSHGRVRGLRFC